MSLTMQPGELTAEDRCDRCGAQAYMRATLPTGSLLFCRHHGREHGDRLAALGALIHDETERAVSA